VLIRGPNGDNTLRARHLELEVGVVGDCHKHGVARTSKDGVVGSLETNHLKSECLLPEVSGGSEADRQVDPSNWLCSFPWHDSMEAPDAGSEVCPLDP
jgi:hypothetical protein